MNFAIFKEEFKVENNIDYQIGTKLQEPEKIIVKIRKSKALPRLVRFKFWSNAFANEFTFFKQPKMVKLFQYWCKLKCSNF